MGFDLWNTLGVDLQTGIAIACGLAGAVFLIATYLVKRRSRSETTRSVGIDLH